MSQYRYRTRVLVGPWRDRPEQARDDAVRAGQAKPAAEGAELEWIVPGSIEQREERKAERRSANAHSS